jgi:hypothetical protein
MSASIEATWAAAGSGLLGRGARAADALDDEVMDIIRSRGGRELCLARPARRSTKTAEISTGC